MCTGITLKAEDGSSIYGHTMEWGSFDLLSRIVIVPPGMSMQATTPDGEHTGLQWVTKLGFVAIDAFEKNMFADGINEAGLTCGLFYHPGSATYEPYDQKHKDRTIGGQELVGYILSQFKSVQEVRDALSQVKVVGIHEAAINMEGPVHYMVVEPSGQAIVIEFLDHETRIFKAPLGVLTNAPEYQWHMTNLRNYVNLSPVGLPNKDIEGIDFSPLGGGSGMIGLPGDFTPPSRMVRAVAFSQTARSVPNAQEAIYEHFRILDNFNVPLGAAEGNENTENSTANMRSATLWTTGADMNNRIYYYHTQHNRRLRKIALDAIDWNGLNGKLRRLALDANKEQDIEDVLLRLVPA